jgi:hypothetical protein
MKKGRGTLIYTMDEKDSKFYPTDSTELKIKILKVFDTTMISTAS